nr:ABC transporter substrate-binding protein [Bartonella doshiae]
MNVTKKMFKSSSSFVSAFIAMGMFAQQVSAKTPADTLVMAWNLDSINSFDPAQINEIYADEIILNVCDSLVSDATDDATKIVPSLAESWDVSGDDQGTVITFHLRDGLKFNDGRPAGANDLIWGFNSLLVIYLYLCNNIHYG